MADLPLLPSMPDFLKPYERLSDIELREIIRNKDQGWRDAYHYLLYRIMPWVQAAVAQRAGSLERYHVECDEVCVDIVAIKTFEREILSQWNPDKSSLKTWVWTCASRYCIDQIRRAKRRGRIETPLSDEVGYPDEDSDSKESEFADRTLPLPDQLARDERDQQLIEAINALNPELRTVIDLLYLDGMTQDDAASVLGVTRRTIINRRNKAREAIQKYLGNDWSDLAARFVRREVA